MHIVWSRKCRPYLCQGDSAFLLVTLRILNVFPLNQSPAVGRIFHLQQVGNFPPAAGYWLANYRFNCCVALQKVHRRSQMCAGTSRPLSPWSIVHFSNRAGKKIMMQRGDWLPGELCCNSTFCMPDISEDTRIGFRQLLRPAYEATFWAWGFSILRMLFCKHFPTLTHLMLCICLVYNVFAYTPWSLATAYLAQKWYADYTKQFLLFLLCILLIYVIDFRSWCMILVHIHLSPSICRGWITLNLQSSW